MKQIFVFEIEIYISIYNQKIDSKVRFMLNVVDYKDVNITL